MIEDQPPHCEAMTGLSTGQLAELIGRVREVVGPEWERPAVGRPHVLALPAAVVAVLFGLRQNLADEVVGEVFGCSQATITRYHEILGPILRWVTWPERQAQYERAQANAALVDGFVAPVGEREDYAGLFSGKKHVSGENVQVVADLGGRVADVGDPVPGARHDSVAFEMSGIADRWSGHARRRRLSGGRSECAVPQATQGRAQRGPQGVQLLAQPAASGGRAGDIALEELEDPQDWLPPTHGELP